MEEYTCKAQKIKCAYQCTYLHLERDQGRRSFTTSVVSSNSFDLFFSVLVCMQEQQSCSLKTWHIDTKIVSNGISKISFVSLLRKKLFFYLYILCFDIVIFRLGVKNWVVKNEKLIIFSELGYAYSNPDFHYHFIHCSYLYFQLYFVYFM